MALTMRAFDRLEEDRNLLPEIENRALLLGIPKESLRRYKRLFQVFDQDGDGRIDPTELHVILNTVGVPTSEEDVIDIIQANDKDNSGVVEFDEFLEIIMCLGGDISWQGANDSAHVEVDDKDFMKKSAEAIRHVRAALENQRTLPDSILRTGVDFMVVITCVYYYCTALLADVGLVDGDGNTVAVIIEIALTLFLFFDLGLAFDTAIVKRGTVISSRKAIARHYLRSWFTVDLLAAIPIDLCVGFGGYSGLGSSNAWKHLRLLKTLKLPQLFPVQNPGAMSPTYVNIHFRWLPPFLMCVQIGLLLHTFAIVWVSLHDCDDWNQDRDRTDPDDPNSCEYMVALYWVVYTLTTVGYGDVAVTNTTQRAFACLLFLGGAAMNGLIVGYLTVFVMRSDIKGDVLDKMRQTMAVLQHFGVPISLQEEMLSFQYHVLQNNLGASYADLIAGLPVPMQDQVAVYIRIRHISQVPMFSRCEMIIKAALAQSLKNVVVPPDEYVIVAGEQGHEMFFLSHGFCDVSSKEGKWMATISKGGFFGEVALLVETNRTADIKALTFCDLFILRKQEFDVILDRFPTFALNIQQEIRSRRTRRTSVRAETTALTEDDGEDPGWVPDIDASNDEIRKGRKNARASLDVIQAVAHLTKSVSARQQEAEDPATDDSGHDSGRADAADAVPQREGSGQEGANLSQVLRRLDTRAKLANDRMKSRQKRPAQGRQLSGWYRSFRQRENQARRPSGAGPGLERQSSVASIPVPGEVQERDSPLVASLQPLHASGNSPRSAQKRSTAESAGSSPEPSVRRNPLKPQRAGTSVHAAASSPGSVWFDRKDFQATGATWARAGPTGDSSAVMRTLQELAAAHVRTQHLLEVMQCEMKRESARAASAEAELQRQVAVVNSAVTRVEEFCKERTSSPRDVAAAPPQKPPAPRGLNTLDQHLMRSTQCNPCETPQLSYIPAAGSPTSRVQSMHIQSMNSTVSSPHRSGSRLGQDTTVMPRRFSSCSNA
eukprot:TRINITY_DN9849_c1_g2_i1.p1 TRINITY_DN9849_c1_g2~~TRINITY_DN9849_c1_g2_i1.p1  ORF type:complete len:1030 (+),score=223.36 TRINITY_DN9849_c1_g2_i1:93-3092(+)